MTPTLKPDPDREHPIVAWASILAVAVAILVIVWARFEVHGTQDLEEALTEEPPAPATNLLKPSAEADKSPREKELDEAVAAGRWATGFSP
ncbi:MAG: hypothetical protein ABI423_03380 [Burkholderiales bacterium]